VDIAAGGEEIIGAFQRAQVFCSERRILWR
jgi:hypothetical protein